MSFHCKLQFRQIPKMRKWSGGLLIITLAVLLVFRYGSIAKIEPDNITSGEENVLDIPCGLIDDSSISLVGIPDGRSFQIQLLGSQIVSPPVILHYNVSLPGDNMTVEPFVIQNSWNNELGWGKEERCPSHRSASNLKDQNPPCLKKKAAKGLLYGLISFESSPDRDKESKWYIGHNICITFATKSHFGWDLMSTHFAQEWPHAGYPPWTHGPGYIISRDIAKFIVRRNGTQEKKYHMMENMK